MRILPGTCVTFVVYVRSLASLCSESELMVLRTGTIESVLGEESGERRRSECEWGRVGERGNQEQ